MPLPEPPPIGSTPLPAGTYDGQVVKVDGFRLLQDPGNTYEVFLGRSQEERGG